MNRGLHAIALASSLLALSGCGGGGGGGSSSGGSNGGGNGGGSSNYPLTVTVAQNPITGSVPQIELPGSIIFSASVSGTTSATTIYVVIQDSAATFSGVPNVTQLSATQYQVAMPLPDTLSMGNRSGNLTISLCADAGCANVLGRRVAPYAITIAENPVMTGSFSLSSVTLAAVKDDDVVNYPVSLTVPGISNISHARITDPAGVLRITGDSQIVAATMGSNNLEITVSPDALPGTYSGNLEAVFCRGATCDRRYRGVTNLPYTVTVYSKTNLKTLAALPGATGWPVLQGSPARTGHVAVTLDPTKFSPRWLWRSPDPTNLPNVLDPVNAGGKVFTVAAPDSTIALTPVLYAIDEASGEVSWQQPVPDPSDDAWGSGLRSFTPPAIAGGNVYISRTALSNPQAQGAMFSFQMANGAPAFTPSIFTETPGEFGDFTHESSLALIWMTPVYMTPMGNSMVLTGLRPNGDGSMQMAVNLTTGAQSNQWASCIDSMPSPPQFAGAAAIDANGDAYLATDTGLLLADTCDTIESAQLSGGMGPVVVPGTTTVVAIGNGNLVAFDTATRQVKWSVLRSDSDVFVRSPAVSDDTVFVQNTANSRVRLEARRVSDGAVLWTWQPPWNDEMTFTGHVVSTNNLVFVSTRRAVYAIDRTSHQAVWTYPYSGKVSISANGVLYVRRGLLVSGNGLAAINLQ